ncbi:DNA N-6-adenine-methyltransferase [Propionibacterium freudenreichii]|uniref:DNA N-6-adenine-methyltransferase n=1 Tax=Propionibacterium freudenreichii TaxID=1744 RepID=UPI00254BFA62|nr:DNA N-6-adenine-methyltransferase [Propionibacterium freudenreichii]
MSSGKGMGGHQSHASKTTTWLTPPAILRALGDFDLDPCGYPGWLTATRMICLPDDGLAADWAGRVWLNPPYGLAQWTWLAKLAAHRHGTALIFARTETRGFVNEVWGKADALLFLHGRIHFHRPGGERAQANAGAPSVLVAYGPQDVAVLAECSLAGTFIQLNRARQAAA